MNTSKLMTCTEAWDAIKSHPFRVAEVPIEHAVSLPMPTQRNGGPGYAQFASPCSRQKQQPTMYSAPDRWWILDAQSRSIRLYARTTVVPFGDFVFERREVKVHASVQELQGLLREIPAVMDVVVCNFFLNTAAPAAARGQASSLLKKVIPEPLLPLYRTLSPDFFAFLEDES